MQNAVVDVLSALVHCRMHCDQYGCVELQHHMAVLNRHCAGSASGTRMQVTPPHPQYSLVGQRRRSPSLRLQSRALAAVRCPTQTFQGTAAQAQARVHTPGSSMSESDESGSVGFVRQASDATKNRTDWFRKNVTSHKVGSGGSGTGHAASAGSHRTQGPAPALAALYQGHAGAARSQSPDLGESLPFPATAGSFAHLAPAHVPRPRMGPSASTTSLAPLLLPQLRGSPSVKRKGRGNNRVAPAPEPSLRSTTGAYGEDGQGTHTIQVAQLQPALHPPPHTHTHTTTHNH